MKRKLFVLLIFVLLSVSYGFSQALTFSITNNTGYDLYGLYLSPAEDSNWGEDLLGEMFTNGSEVTVDIGEQYGETCMFDIRITIDASEETDIVFSQADLCRIWTIILNEDGTYDVTYDE
jgi:hypothetical protein